MAADTSNKTIESIGNYEIIAKIAEGGMGSVYKGRSRQSGQIVAIKIVPANTAKNTVLIERFKQEFKAASLLDHPNIVRALDYGEGETPFLVMEFVDGESLGQKVEREGRMPEEEAIRLIGQVCQGLHRAHRANLIHRDVKPDNVMVTRDGQAKLTDLGLVKGVDVELNLTKTGRGLGTPHFMAPEQFRDAKNADVRCDIYSLGATLYVMVTGQNPFGQCGPLDAWMKKVHNDYTQPRKLVPDLSERADWAIRRAMSADPEMRPQSCREFIEDLTGQTTRKLVPSSEPVAAPRDLWYLIYKDEQGTTHTVKGSTDGIRRSLKEGLLGDAANIRACRTKTGPFEPLRNLPEFHEMLANVPTPQELPTAGTTPNPALKKGSARLTPSEVAKLDLVQPAAPQSVDWFKWAMLGLVAAMTALLALALLLRLT